MKTKSYDYIISLGENCFMALLLKEMNLRKASFPFDWSRGIRTDLCGITGFQGKINMILQGFDSCFEEPDLREFHRDSSFPFLFMVNIRTGLQYTHDFPKDVPIKEFFPVYKERYLRRSARLNECCRNKKILFCFVAQTQKLPLSLVRKAKEDLRSYFKNPLIDFIIFNPNSDLDPLDYTYFFEDGMYAFEINNDYFAPGYKGESGNMIVMKKIMDRFLNRKFSWGSYFKYQILRFLPFCKKKCLKLKKYYLY